LHEYAKTETTDKRLQDIISGFYDIEEWHTPPVDPKKIATVVKAIEDGNDDYPDQIIAKTTKKDDFDDEEEENDESDEDKAKASDADINKNSNETEEDAEDTSDGDDLDLFESGPDPVIAKNGLLNCKNYINST
jgi:hypothetical protein